MKQALEYLQDADAIAFALLGEERSAGDVEIGEEVEFSTEPGGT